MTDVVFGGLGLARLTAMLVSVNIIKGFLVQYSRTTDSTTLYSQLMYALENLESLRKNPMQLRKMKASWGKFGRF